MLELIEKCIQQSIKEIMLKSHKDLIIFWVREHGKRVNRPCLKREVDAESEIKLIIEEDGVPCPTVIKNKRQCHEDNGLAFEMFGSDIDKKRGLGAFV